MTWSKNVAAYPFEVGQTDMHDYIIFFENSLTIELFKEATVNLPEQNQI